MMASNHLGAAPHTGERRNGESAELQRESARRLPIVTLAVFTVTELCNVLQIFFPQLLGVLRRDPAALQAGQWWRLVTPLLVQSDGWWAAAYVALGILLAGIVVERIYGRLRWLLLYLGGGLVGEVAGYAWDPHGAGSSVGVFGLLGGLLVYACWKTDFFATLRQRGLLTILALLYCVGLFGALAGGDTGSQIVGWILGALLASALIWLIQLRAPARVSAVYVGLVSLVGALLMTAWHDIHGPAFLAGACIGVLLLALDPALRRPDSY